MVPILRGRWGVDHAHRPPAEDPLSHTAELAGFALSSSWQDLSDEVRRHLKLRVLDALGCAVGAVDGEPVEIVARHLTELGGEPRVTRIGGGRTAPDRAALLNGFLVRYLDFNDSYLAPGETCHPSDNLAPVLAATELAGGDGRRLLTALAVAYQVQCRLSDEAPVRHLGFDHVTHLAFSASAGAARALELDRETATHAVSIAGTRGHALRATRTGTLSHWKGLAAPAACASALGATLLARAGITGPDRVVEGTRGWREAVTGPWGIDWDAEPLDCVTRTDLKRFNAEIHAQAALEGLVELMEDDDIASDAVESIHVEIFDVAHDIIGGGKEGEKTHVRTKEEADHSLPWLLAVASLDGTVMPEQYDPDRIRAEDVRRRMERVTVEPREELSQRFPEAHPCRVTVVTRSGETHLREKEGYRGFHDTPLSWDAVEEKVRHLGRGRADDAVLDELVAVVQELEHAALDDLLEPLARVRTPG